MQSVSRPQADMSGDPPARARRCQSRRRGPPSARAGRHRALAFLATRLRVARGRALALRRLDGHGARRSDARRRPAAGVPVRAPPRHAAGERDRDPGHGLRAAAFARELRDEGVLELSDEELELLARAIELHSDGRVTDEPTTAVCWDADRLHLPRVGITPDPARFSIGFARSEEWAARAARLREQPPGWGELVAVLARGPIPEPYRVAGRLFAGEYPGAASEVEARERLAAFAGVDVFVDLSHEADGLPPYEQLLAGGVRRSRDPGARLLRALGGDAGARARRDRRVRGGRPHRLRALLGRDRADGHRRGLLARSAR